MKYINDEWQLPEDAEMLLSDARGQYIPRDFVDAFYHTVKHGYKKYVNRNILKNPDHALYWDYWDSVLTHVIIISKTGKEYYLYQDGDLYAIPKGETV